MSSFLGIKVLTDLLVILLVMGSVGVYVNHPVVEGIGTLGDTTDSALITLQLQVSPCTLPRRITTSTPP